MWRRYFGTISSFFFLFFSFFSIAVSATTVQGEPDDPQTERVKSPRNKACLSSESNPGTPVIFYITLYFVRTKPRINLSCVAVAPRQEVRQTDGQTDIERKSSPAEDRVQLNLFFLFSMSVPCSDRRCDSHVKMPESCRSTSRVLISALRCSVSAHSPTKLAQIQEEKKYTRSNARIQAVVKIEQP